MKLNPGVKLKSGVKLKTQAKSTTTPKKDYQGYNKQYATKSKKTA